VDFRNAVVVMTSNLGSQIIQEMMSRENHSADYAAIKEAVMGVVNQHFRPEFINRIDEAVVFHPLGSGQIRSIAAVQSQRVQKRLAEHGIRIHFSDAALDHLAQAGFDPVYGARPLKRAIQTLVENPLARAILDGEFASGDAIEVDTADGTIRFSRA
jgi:ATP-dependent Clp protease ATP-binding subunit ClpB